jgi:hypothetical protein
VAVRAAEDAFNRARRDLDAARGDDPEASQPPAEFLAKDCLAGDPEARVKMNGLLRSMIRVAEFRDGEVLVVSARGKADVILTREGRATLGLLRKPKGG